MTPLKSVGMARYMKEKVAGMEVPDEIINRLKGGDKKDQAKEGIKICVETIQRLKDDKGSPASISWRSSGRKRVPEIVKWPACCRGRQWSEDERQHAKCKM